MRETTLDGNQWLDENKNLKWMLFEKSRAAAKLVTKIEIKPMEIRTFIIKFKYQEPSNGNGNNKPQKNLANGLGLNCINLFTLLSFIYFFYN